jgi:hypothetical protein
MVNCLVIRGALCIGESSKWREGSHFLGHSLTSRAGGC